MNNGWIVLFCFILIQLQTSKQLHAEGDLDGNWINLLTNFTYETNQTNQSAAIPSQTTSQTRSQHVSTIQHTDHVLQFMSLGLPIGLFVGLFLVSATVIIQAVHLLNTKSKLCMVVVPIISIILWTDLMRIYLVFIINFQWDFIAQIVLKTLLYIHCYFIMLLCFNHKWKVILYRYKVYTNAPGMLQFIFPFIYRSSVFAGITTAFICCYLTIFEVSDLWKPMQLASVMYLLSFHCITTTLLFIIDRSFDSDKSEKWENILKRELIPSQKRWSLTNYILLSTLIFQFITSAQSFFEVPYDNITASSLIMMQIVMDFVVVIGLRYKNICLLSFMNMSPTSPEMPPIFPVFAKSKDTHQSEETVTSNSPKIGSFDHEMFQKFIQGRTYEDGCISPEALKSVCVKVLEPDLMNGVLDKTGLYQLLDILLAKPCDEVWNILCGFRSQSDGTSETKTNTNTNNKITVHAVPRLNLPSNKTPLQQIKEGFNVVPAKRRLSYQHRVGNNIIMKSNIPSAISEGEEWIYDWNSVSCDLSWL